jgi:glutamine---fructose-6-phosphate transaminase (isomerizing)
MYITETEIFSQYNALQSTYNYFESIAPKIREFKLKHDFKSITYIGCGSSYYLSQSAEISAGMRMGIPIHSIPAGDLMLNFQQYKSMLKDTLLVVISRSGSTSEILLAADRVKNELGCPCISICAREKSELSVIVDISLEIPWAFDESVCQTRTVTNLYAGNLLLIGILTGDTDLMEEVGGAIDTLDVFIKKHTSILKGISQDMDWDKVVILADSELQGIASEAALAFLEICQVQSNYYHLLDVRHGPIVLINSTTLVIAATCPDGIAYQQDLVGDIKRQGAGIVLAGSETEADWRSDYNIYIPEYKNYAVRGIPFIFIAQTIAYYKALEKGVNPDVPQGLDPWIKLG